MKKSKAQEAKDRWIAETQMFQRIAGTPESTYEELSKDWDEFKTSKRKQREIDSIQTHLAIMKAAGAKDPKE